MVKYDGKERDSQKNSNSAAIYSAGRCRERLCHTHSLAVALGLCVPHEGRARASRPPVEEPGLSLTS